MSQNHPNQIPTHDPKKMQSQVAGESNEEEEDGEETVVQQRFLLFNVMPSWMVSFISHIALIIILALLVLPKTPDKTVALEAGDPGPEQIEQLEVNLDNLEFDEEEALETELEESEPEEVIEQEVPMVETEEVFDIPTEVLAGPTEIVGEMSFESANETDSRSEDSKKKALKKYGGSQASEEAVQLGLKWIADHQLPDGSWSFDHRIGPGKHRTSPNAGTASEARLGATALAILPFLGNGQTHLNGKYKKNVEAGLDFLMRNSKRAGRGLTYRDNGGTMYSHGLAAITFCEAYAMTKDSRLAPYAQGTLWYIEDAQDPVGGGWRYTPRQAGDTSAVGWQVMALKSGKLSGFDIKPRTYKMTSKFLDSVSIDSGAIYGYTDAPRDRNRGHRGRTAIGLLCRMYMGWERDSPGLSDGIQYIRDCGPDVNKNGASMYYNYYGTQLMKHYGGEEWKEWNSQMRDFLVNSQSKEGVTAGSWMFGQKGHADEKGGRLYVTALATMTLEVYYRYLPLYSDKASEDEFPLD